VMPYGYRRHPETKRVLIDASEARIIRRIFTLKAQGLTMRAIARELNRRHYISPRGKEWRHSSVQVVYAGEVYYRGGQRGASALRWPVILKDNEPSIG
jgi:hypothetical protein